MSNHNIARNLRNLSIIALIALGGTALENLVKPSPGSNKAPLVSIVPVQELFDGGYMPLAATVKAGKPGDPIESVKFSVENLRSVPAGTEVTSPKEGGANAQGETVVANIAAPSSGSGDMIVKVTATEADGARGAATEAIPYTEPPAGPY